MKLNIKNPYFWLTSSEVFGFIINYSLVIILAKILEPESFGVVALLNLYTGFFASISGLAIGKMIINGQIKDNKKLSGLLISSLIFSLFLTILGLLFLYLFLHFYFEEVLNDYYYYGVLSLLSIVLSTLYKFSNSLYIRDKDFIRLAKLTITSYLISFVLIILTVYFLRTTLVLLFKQIIVALVPIMILLLFSNFSFKMFFEKKILKDFFSFSKFITLTDLFNYGVRNMDYIILGRFFDNNTVGQYSIAYKILVTPVKMLIKQVDSISFPTLVNMKNDLKKMKIYYLDNVSLIAQAIFPFTISVIFFSDILVETFFNSDFDKLSKIISILSVSAIFQSVTVLVGNMYIIADKTKLMFKISVLLSILLFIILLIGAKTEVIEYFTLSYVLAYIFTNFPITNYNALKPYKISIFDVLTRMYYPLLIPLIIFGTLCILDKFYNFNIFIKITLVLVSLLISYIMVNKKVQQFLNIKENVWYCRSL